MTGSVLKLKGNGEIREVFEKGKSYVNKYYVIYVLKTGKSFNKVAVCAGKKLGNAVLRNRIRRRALHAYREIATELTPGFNIVLIARATLHQEEFSLLVSSLREIFKRAGIYR